MSEQYSTLLRELADDLDISDNRRQEAEERYQSIGEWLEREASGVRQFAPRIYPQGSFRLGTVTKPITGDDEYDIDLVCQLNLIKDLLTQKQLKEMVGKEIKAYAKANSMLSKPENRKKCWTLTYADEAKFHMDVLPCIGDPLYTQQLLLQEVQGSWAETAIALTDKTHPDYERISEDWPHSNPIGYAEWFKGRMKTVFASRRQVLAESMQENIENVPEYKVKTPLQRVLQILKHHRDIMFEDDSDDKPVSIIISTLAAHAYNNEADLLTALLNVLNEMENFINVRNGRYSILNPVDPLEDFADKWLEYPQRRDKFFAWLRQAKLDFKVSVNKGDIHAFAESLKPHLGEGIVNGALQKTAPRKIVPAKSTSRAVIRFNVSHRQRPKWHVQLNDRAWVHLTAHASHSGFRPQQIKSDGKKLSKSCSLRFVAKTNVRWPYKVYWQVVNTGQQARDARGLRGGFYDGLIDNTVNSFKKGF